MNIIKPQNVQGIIDKFCYTIGIIPTSYKNAMTYEEQIIAIGKYLEENVYPAINNNAQALAELQGLFVELKEYVDNYFDNLDVQTEINNKLDDMVEDGSMAEIINQEIFGELDTAVTNLQGDVRDLQTALGTAEGDIDNLQTAVGNNTDNISKLNLDTFETIDVSDVTISHGSIEYFGVSTATNSDGSIGKLYGTVIINAASDPHTFTISFPTNLRPSEQIYIRGTNLLFIYTAEGLANVGAEAISINTDGTVSFSSLVAGATQLRYDLFACLLFLKNFGDEPENT